MLLVLKSLAGELPPLEVSADTTIKDLKQRICDVCPEFAEKRLRIVRQGGERNSINEVTREDLSLATHDINSDTQLAILVEEFRVFDQVELSDLFIAWSSVRLSYDNSQQKLLETTFICCKGSVDFSQLHAKIAVFRYQIPTFVTACAQSLIYNFTINRLNLSNNRDIFLTGSTISILMNALTPNKSIIELDLSQNALDFSAAAHITEMINNNKAIQILNLSKNLFLDEGILKIAKSLAKNSTITDINLSSNIVKKSASVPVPSTSLTQRLDLELIRLRNPVQPIQLNPGVTNPVQVVPTHAIPPVNVLNQNFVTPEDQNLNADLVNTSHRTSVALARMLLGNSTIRKLKIGNLGLEDYGVSQISQALRSNTSVTDIDISENQMGSDGFKAFAKMLTFNRVISTIKFDSLRFDDRQVRALAQSLLSNSSVTSLELGFLSQEVSDARAFTAMIKSNPSITSFKIHQLSSFSSEAKNLRTGRLTGN